MLAKAYSLFMQNIQISTKISSTLLVHLTCITSRLCVPKNRPAPFQILPLSIYVRYALSIDSLLKLTYDVLHFVFMHCQIWEIFQNFCKIQKFLKEFIIKSVVFVSILIHWPPGFFFMIIVQLNKYINYIILNHDIDLIV